MNRLSRCILLLMICLAAAAPVGSTARPAEAERNSVCSDVTPSGRFHDAAPNQRAVVSGAWSLGFCVLWFRRAISRFLSNHPEQSVDS